MMLCSACLLGIQCRYDGKVIRDEAVINLSKKEVLIPVCPEQLGGLPTPREQSERVGSRVIFKSGRDVTENFKEGAEKTLEIAKKLGIKKAILKQRSSSCGSGQISDGTFKGRIIKGNGVAAELLIKNGIKVISEKEVES